MARSRNIKPGLFKNEILGVADPLYTLLFEGLWTLADREGRLEDRPLRIKGEIFPYREGIDVGAMLDWLQANGFIRRYTAAGKKCIFIIEFRKHQNPHKNETESELPSPDGLGCETDEIGKTSEKIGITPADLLIPDSPTTDSGLSDSLIPDCGENTLSGKPDCDGEDSDAPENKTDLPSGIFSYWQRVMGSPRSQLDAKRRRTIKAALKMGYSPHELCRAIRGCSLTPHNMGKNDRGQKYNGIDLIFRSADQIDRFIANDSAPPKPSQTSGVGAQNDALVAAFLARDGESNADPMIIDMEQ